MAEKALIRFDWAIKTMLRDKANFDILEGFLSALLREDITLFRFWKMKATLKRTRKSLIESISWSMTPNSF